MASFNVKQEPVLVLYLDGIEAAIIAGRLKTTPAEERSPREQSIISALDEGLPQLDAARQKGAL